MLAAGHAVGIRTLGASRRACDVAIGFEALSHSLFNLPEFPTDRRANDCKNGGFFFHSIHRLDGDFHLPSSAEPGSVRRGVRDSKQENPSFCRIEEL